MNGVPVQTSSPNDNLITALRDRGMRVTSQRVVVHRYQMELIEPLWPRLGKVWVGEAQRLRERLGKHQDLAVLRRLTLRGQLLARWNKLLTPAVDARQRDHIEAAMRLTTRLFAERPQDFQRRLEAMWEPQTS